MYFYLGSPEPSWLAHIGVPAFVSRTRLLRYKDKFPRATVPWAMDSGGFTQVTQHGGWCVSPKEFVREVAFYRSEIGNLDWASPMDWMCEEIALKRSGKTLKEHQRLTLENFIELRNIAPWLPFIPVLQGSSVADYLRHAEQYERAGFDLSREKLVGVGSVCRRQGCGDATRILKAVHGLGIKVHAFGLSTLGLRTACQYIVSADSMAWSATARGRYVERRGTGKRVHVEYVLMPGHQHSKRKEDNDCRNCPAYALVWRKKMLDSVPRGAGPSADARGARGKCVVKHPRMRTVLDLKWLASESRLGSGVMALRQKRKRGEPTSLEVEKMLSVVRDVVGTNQLLDEEELVEAERGSMFVDRPVPKTYRVALSKPDRVRIKRWTPLILKRKAKVLPDSAVEILRTDLVAALAAKTSGWTPPPPRPWE